MIARIQRLWQWLRSQLVWLVKSLFFDSKGTLSLGRTLGTILIANGLVLVWLAVVWVAYVTRTNQMGEAAALAAAIGTWFSSLGIGQVVAGAGLYLIQARFGPGGVSSSQIGGETPAAANPGGI